jgi:rhodanese-related sulfurtransferase
MSNSTFYIYTGVAGLLVSLYSGFQYYALSGMGLLTSRKAKKMIRNGEISHVVDVRTKTEYNLGHYPNAKNIPVTQMSASKFRSMPKQDGILVYCNTGQRARRAAEKLRSYGFENVYYIKRPHTSIL